MSNNEQDTITLTRAEMEELLKGAEKNITMPDLSKLDSAAQDVIQGNPHPVTQSEPEQTDLKQSILYNTKPMDIDKRDLRYFGLSVIMGLIIVCIICISVVININVSTKSDLKYQEIQISTLKEQNTDLKDKLKETKNTVNDLSDQVEELEKKIKEIEESNESSNEEEGEY